MIKVQRSAMRQAFLFLIVGGLSAAIDAGVFWILTLIGVFPAIASGVSFLSAFVVNYRGNRDLVFRTQQRQGALKRYGILVAANLAVSTAGVAFGVWVGMSPIIAKAITMIIVAISNFIAMRLWVFSSPSRDSSTSAAALSD
jgi:putative flippase GtrA